MVGIANTVEVRIGRKTATKEDFISTFCSCLNKRMYCTCEREETWG